MPIRNENIDLLLLVAGEYAVNDEEHYESYLFINGTTLFTNDSYFSPRGWIDPGTCYQKCLWGKSYQNRERLKSDIELLHSIINVFFAWSHFNKDTKYEVLEISSICIFNSYIFQQVISSATSLVIIFFRFSIKIWLSFFSILIGHCDQFLWRRAEWYVSLFIFPSFHW